MRCRPNGHSRADVVWRDRAARPAVAGRAAYRCIDGLCFVMVAGDVDVMARSDQRRMIWALPLLGAAVSIGLPGSLSSGREPDAAAKPPVTTPDPPRRPAMSQLIFRGVAPSDVRAMLDAGGDPLLPDRDGDTAVHYAAMARDPAYLEILLARGASPDTPNRSNGRTPLMAAMLAENDRQFSRLLAAGASAALADATGNTPLHVAAQINEPRYVLALLDAGAPATARNAQGQTFQRYLFMTPDRLLNTETLQARRAVLTWLRQHGIALETPVP